MTFKHQTRLDAELSISMKYIELPVLPTLQLIPVTIKSVELAVLNNQLEDRRDWKFYAFHHHIDLLMKRIAESSRHKIKLDA